MPDYVIPEHVLANAPWSISKAGMLEKCSLQFHYKYKLKLVEQATFNNSRLGTAVHRALELALEGAVTVDKAFDMARLEEELTETETEQLLAFRMQVSAFVAKMHKFKLQHGVRETLLEAKMALKPDFTSTAFFDKTGFLRGVIDYAMITADGYAIIIDHKSGKQKELKEYDTQMRTYCLMILAKYPQLKGVQTAINFVMTDQLLWNKMVLADEIREKYQPWLVDYMIKTCKPLLLPPAATQSWACQWCAYGPKAANPVCPLFGGDGTVKE